MATGIWKDDVVGLFKKRLAASFKIAQDEECFMVFEMPRNAIAAGAVHIIFPL